MKQWNSFKHLLFWPTIASSSSAARWAIREGGGITYFRSTGNRFWSPVVRHSFLSVHLLTFSFQLFYQNNWVYKPNFAQNILWRSSIPSFLNKYLFNLLEIRLDRVTLRYTVLKVPSILLPLYMFMSTLDFWSFFTIWLIKSSFGTNMWSWILQRPTANYSWIFS